MFKNLISPIQAWLLSQGRCVGCGDTLSHGQKSSVKGKELVTCRCGRIFVHDSKKDIYRRAMFDEI
jgi:predicted  nucleic acid-binding Zn-ribbon protein